MLVFFASGLVLGMVQAAVLSYLPLYTIQALGFDTIGAGLLVACSQAGGAVSRLGPGAAGGRWGARRGPVGRGGARAGRGRRLFPLCLLGGSGRRPPRGRGSAPGASA